MILATLLACMGSSDDSGSGPVTWTSDAGLYELSFTTDPAPLTSGPAHFDITAEGATFLGFDALMISMGHGLSEDPVVDGTDGTFTVDCVFSMSGTWRLTFDLDGEAGADTVSGDVEVD